MSACDPSDLFDPQGNDLLLDFDRGSDELPHAPVILPQSSCYQGRGVIKVHQGQTVNLVLPVIDRSGSPIQLVGGSSSSSAASVSDVISNLPTHEGDPANPAVGYIWYDSVGDRIRTRLATEVITLMGMVMPAAATEDDDENSESSSSTVGMFAVRFYAKPNETGRILSINKSCEVQDAERGLVSTTLTASDLARPGLQPAQLAIYSSDGEHLYQVVPYWLHVSPSLQHSTTGPLTLMEVRMVVADQCPEANVLMDALEFSDEEIAIFIRRAVDEFNEKYQPPTHYTPQTFPWRFHWSLGVAGSMLRSKAIQIRRNELHYQAGGVTVQDDEHAGDYMKIAKGFLQEWQEFIVSRKRTLNIEAGYATQLSGYAYTGYRGVR